MCVIQHNFLKSIDRLFCSCYSVDVIDDNCRDDHKDGDKVVGSSQYTSWQVVGAVCLVMQLGSGCEASGANLRQLSHEVTAGRL